MIRSLHFKSFKTQVQVDGAEPACLAQAISQSSEEPFFRGHTPSLRIHQTWSAPFQDKPGPPWDVFTF